MKNLATSLMVMGLAVFSLTACNAELPDIEDVQAEVAEQVEAQGLERPDDVSCSGLASISAGMSVICELHYDDQGNQSAEASITRVGSDGITMDVDVSDDR